MILHGIVGGVGVNYKYFFFSGKFLLTFLPEFTCCCPSGRETNKTQERKSKKGIFPLLHWQIRLMNADPISPAQNLPSDSEYDPHVQR